MNEEKETWNEVEVPEQEVDYEVEEDTPIQQEAATPEEPPELEGIQTKGAEKRIRQLVRQRKERDEHIAHLIAQNEVLANTLNKKDHDFTEVSKLNLDASEKQLTDKMSLARNSYMEAFESGEKEKLLQAQEMLNEAQTDLKNLNVTKARIKQLPRKAVQPQQAAQPQQQVQPTPDPKAEDWAAQNEWFGKDRMLTMAALTIDQDLKEEGFDTNNDDFYQEVDRRLAQTFPNKFNSSEVDVEQVENRRQENTSAPAQVVGSSSRSAPASTKGKVKLTKEDVRLANKWNIPLETYAAEKLKVADSDGEYTQIT